MLRREGIPIDEVDENTIERVVEAVARGVIAKEAIPDILAYLAKNPGTTVEQAINALGLKTTSVDELDKLIENIIASNKEKLLSKQSKAFNIVMSEVMKTMRGKVDGKLIADRVKVKLREVLNIEI